MKDSNEVGDINDFLQAFPDDKMAAVARLKLKQLRRRSKPKVDRIKPESFSQQSTLRVCTLPAVIGRTRIATIARLIAVVKMYLCIIPAESDVTLLVQSYLVSCFSRR